MTNGTRRRWLSRLGASRLGGLALACTLMLGACAQQPGYDASLTPAENELRASNIRFNNTVLTGAVTGALLGAGAGALLAGRNNRAQGALVGAAAGGALGAGAGYGVASNNQRQTQSEDTYNALIQEAQTRADQARKSAAASRVIADDAAARLRTLNAQYASKQISADAYRAQLARQRDNLNVLNERIREADSTSATLRTQARGLDRARAAPLLASATDLDRSNAEMKNAAAQMTRTLAATPQSI